MRSSSTTSTLNSELLDKYKPVPIILPDIPVGSSERIPPRIVSPVTAVSESKGVGSGRMSFKFAFT